MEFINLTEHQINVLSSNDIVVLSLPGAAKENVLRACVEYRLVGTDERGFDVFESAFALSSMSLRGAGGSRLHVCV